MDSTSVKVQAVDYLDGLEREVDDLKIVCPGSF